MYIKRKHTLHPSLSLSLIIWHLILFVPQSLFIFCSSFVCCAVSSLLKVPLLLFFHPSFHFPSHTPSLLPLPPFLYLCVSSSKRERILNPRFSDDEADPVEFKLSLYVQYAFLFLFFFNALKTSPSSPRIFHRSLCSPSSPSSSSSSSFVLSL